MVKQHRKSEPNVDVERRCGHFRVRVRVNGFPADTRTFDSDAEVWAWGRRRRLEMLAAKAEHRSGEAPHRRAPRPHREAL